MGYAKVLEVALELIGLARKWINEFNASKHAIDSGDLDTLEARSKELDGELAGASADLRAKIAEARAAQP